MQSMMRRMMHVIDDANQKDDARNAIDDAKDDAIDCAMDAKNAMDDAKDDAIDCAMDAKG